MNKSFNHLWTVTSVCMGIIVKAVVPEAFSYSLDLILVLFPRLATDLILFCWSLVQFMCSWFNCPQGMGSRFCWPKEKFGIWNKFILTVLSLRVILGNLFLDLFSLILKKSSRTIVRVLMILYKNSMSFLSMAAPFASAFHLPQHSCSHCY